MVIGIVQWVIISLILIMLVHHLFSFFKNTLTVPKVKDLVNQPSQLYKEIEQTLTSSDNSVKLTSNNNNSNNNNNYSNNNSNNNNLDTKEMKNELKKFFNELSQNKSTTPSLQSSNFHSNMFSEI